MSSFKKYEKRYIHYKLKLFKLIAELEDQQSSPLKQKERIDRVASRD